MFGTFHVLIGYVVGWFSFRLLGIKERGDGFLAGFLGVVPDVDVFSPSAFGSPFGHHGITHSPFLLTLVSMPFLLNDGRRKLPYYFALMSHIAADLVENVVPIFSPFSWDQLGLNLFSRAPQLVTVLEMVVICLFLVVALNGQRVFPLVIPDRYSGVASLAAVMFALPIVLLPAIWQLLDLASALSLLTWLVSYLIVWGILVLNVRRANNFIFGRLRSREAL
jgi:hypothetical protein